MIAIEQQPPAETNGPVRLVGGDGVANEGAVPGSRAVTVLLATASLCLVRAFRKVASAAGLTLVVSPDGLHALMTALRQPPALIVLDSALPGVDPDTVETMLARDIRTAEVPVLRCVGAGTTDPSDRTPDGHAA